MYMLFFNNLFSQIVGNKIDEHECSIDGGYQWCDTLGACISLWELECPIQTEICASSEPTLCLNCPIPDCLFTQCALMIGNCCHYECIYGH